MNWKSNENEPAPPATHTMELGPVRLTVCPATKDVPLATWQFASITFGKHTDKTIPECLDTWPSDVIALVRTAIDEFEHELIAVAGPPK